MRRLPEGVFTPTPSRIEAKSDSTTTIARKIVDFEVAARAAKTERLRAARLARDAEEIVIPIIKRKPRKLW